MLGAEKLSLIEIEAFLAASECVRFAGCGRTEIYSGVERLLCHHEYPLPGRCAKGLLRAYVERMLTRLGSLSDDYSQMPSLRTSSL
ncbi:MAG TPA: hypothetical protein VGF01_08885 [Terracidiphilus sp.]